MNPGRVIEDIINWGIEKGIDNPDKQTIKLMEECGELAHEISRGRYHSNEVKDAIGDIGVVLIILADILDMDFGSCLNMAYEAIKDRHGKTVDGSFIKEDPTQPHDERVNFQSF